MSNFGGPNSAFEKDLQARIAKMNVAIGKHQKNIQNTMGRVLNQQSVRNNAYWSKAIKDLNKEYKGIVTSFNTFAKVDIPSRYTRSITQMSIKINGLKSVTNKAKKSIAEMLVSIPSRQTMRALYEDSLASMVSSALNGKQAMIRLTRMTQQALIQESVIDIGIATSFEQGTLGKSIAIVKSDLYKALAARVPEEQFVVAGKRAYTPKYYAEMVGRVKYHEAHSYATIATAKNYGTDLVIISSHNTTTRICLDFEGKVFSLSGRDKRFPILMLYPPFHPNCLHLQYPQFESGMVAQGTLKQFEDFSAGRIDRPPVPAGFIPARKRKVA